MKNFVLSREAAFWVLKGCDQAFFKFGLRDVDFITD